MEQNKSLGLLSLARKGGNIVLGEEQAGAAARASRAADRAPPAAPPSVWGAASAPGF